MTRQSHLAQIFIKVRVGHDDCFLLMRHDKWGDWSLVGGHVEPEEKGDWARAAAREANEELTPLVHRKDFILVPLLREPITWGPEQSRSAGGIPTMYTAQFFALRFLVTADEALARLDPDRFALVPQQRLAASTARDDIATTVATARGSLAGGLHGVPLASPDSIAKSSLSIAVQDRPRGRRNRAGDASGVIGHQR